MIFQFHYLVNSTIICVLFVSNLFIALKFCLLIPPVEKIGNLVDNVLSVFLGYLLIYKVKQDVLYADKSSWSNAYVCSVKQMKRLCSQPVGILTSFLSYMFARWFSFCTQLYY